MLADWTGRKVLPITPAKITPTREGSFTNLAARPPTKATIKTRNKLVVIDSPTN